MTLQHGGISFAATLVLLLFAPQVRSCVGADQQPLLKLYLSPQGNDDNSGLALDAPIATLTRAHEIIGTTIGTNHRHVQVRIGPGRYDGQRVKWTFTMPRHTITFMPVFDDRNRPVFNGDGNGTWFDLHGHKSGTPTNLHFRYIRVQNYEVAISFSGERLRSDSSSAHNSIYGCYFWQNGKDSTAVVLLVNSRNNRIANNHFRKTIRTTNQSLLHAIYAAHRSTNNVIEGNHFEVCVGDPIKFRDRSNDNKVINNRFIRCGIQAAVNEWYCNSNRRTDCKRLECASWNNVVRNNRLDRTYAGDTLLATYVQGVVEIPAGCPRPSPGVRRFIESGNTHE